MVVHPCTTKEGLINQTFLWLFVHEMCTLSTRGWAAPFLRSRLGLLVNQENRMSSQPVNRRNLLLGAAGVGAGLLASLMARAGRPLLRLVLRWAAGRLT